MNFYEAWTEKGGHYLIGATSFREAASHFVETVRLEETKIEGVIIMGEPSASPLTNSVGKEAELLVEV